MQQKTSKNSLSIRLTESVVFLRNNDSTAGRNNVSTSMLRGLLVLDLVKPTRISSIDIELQGKSFSSWPEGFGSRRIEITEEHSIFNASTVFFRAGTTPSSRRTASVGPGLSFYRDDDDHEPSHHLATPRNGLTAGRGYNEPPTLLRRTSADSSIFQRDFISHRENNIPLPPSSYTPVMRSSPHSAVFSSAPSTAISRLEDNAAQTLEESRNTLWAGMEAERRSPSQNGVDSRGRSPMNTSSNSSIYSFRDTSLSRQPSVDDVPEYEPPQLQLPSTPPPSSPTTSTDDRRGRRHSRFSISAVSNVILDAVKERVRSSSPQARIKRDATASRERGIDRSRDSRATSSRGRTLEPRKDNEHNQKGSTFSKFGDLLKLDTDDKESGDGWKEFKKGTYTYPISFVIPGDSPPTLDCTYGSVRWRLKANVHRPGAFIPKMSTTREVVLIGTPGEDDTEDTENIIVERQWDSQLQYLISISGRSFYIGGTMPLHITMLPMAKMKVHRISVILEERIDYYAQMKRIARTDPVHRISLLALKSDQKECEPILPLVSDDPEAFKHSPFYSMLTPHDDPSEMASSLMGPGPWTFHYELPLPNSCGQIHFTNKNKRSNITIAHNLKVIFRVERGDGEFSDPKTGKPKLFDIVVHTPVHILSCRCNPEWTSLPRYTELLLDDLATAPRTCPCGFKLRERSKSRADPYASRGIFTGAKLDRVDSRQSTDSASTAESASVNHLVFPSLRQLDSLYNRNSQFERLVSGQESERGEAPPAYDAVSRTTAVP